MKTKAAVLHEMGKTGPYAQSRPLVIEDLELDAPKAGEVLVELVGAGLCHSDLSTIDGTRPRPTPMVLGHEASGIVRDIGPSVVDLKPDDHVVFSFVPMCGRCLCCATGATCSLRSGRCVEQRRHARDGRRAVQEGRAAGLTSPRRVRFFAIYRRGSGVADQD